MDRAVGARQGVPKICDVVQGMSEPNRKDGRATRTTPIKHAAKPATPHLPIDSPSSAHVSTQVMAGLKKNSVACSKLNQ